MITATFLMCQRQDLFNNRWPSLIVTASGSLIYTSSRKIFKCSLPNRGSEGIVSWAITWHSFSNHLTPFKCSEANRMFFIHHCPDYHNCPEFVWKCLLLLIELLIFFSENIFWSYMLTEENFHSWNYPF